MLTNVSEVLSNEVVVQLRGIGLLLPMRLEFNRLGSTERRLHCEDIGDLRIQIAPNSYSCGVLLGTTNVEPGVIVTEVRLSDLAHEEGERF